MRIISIILNFGDIVGFFLLVIGFFLIPFIIGIPIFISGILLLVFNFYKKWVDRLIPKSAQEKIGNEIKKSYIPYQPAINSMKSIGKDVIKTSAIVFIVLVIVAAAILFLRFGIGGSEDSWICDNQGGWIKHGNPAYPSPIAPCTKNNPLPRNKQDCLTQGGIWKKQGLDLYETCNRKAVDRGSLCRDNSECEGMCQVKLDKEEISLAMRGKLKVTKKYGQCSVWVIELGCYGIMKQGKVEVICMD